MPTRKTSRNSAFIFDWRIAEITQAIRGDNTCTAATDNAASALTPAAPNKHQTHHEISGVLFMEVLYQIKTYSNVELDHKRIAHSLNIAALCGDRALPKQSRSTKAIGPYQGTLPQCERRQGRFKNQTGFFGMFHFIEIIPRSLPKPKLGGEKRENSVGMGLPKRRLPV